MEKKSEWVEKMERMGFKEGKVWWRKGRGEWLLVGSEKGGRFIMKKVEKWVVEEEDDEL